MRNPSTKKAMNSATSAAAATTTATSSTPCCSKVGLKRGPWTPEEDELLSNYIKKEGEGKWRTLPKKAGLLRCGKSCRLRWMNYLRPNVKRGQISSDEEDLILRLHRLLGNRWSLIAGRIPGRTDNEIKNYWNTHLSKKLISQGIDPRTHKPLNSSSSSTTTIFAHHHRHHQATKLASLSSTRAKRNNASSSSTSEKKSPNYEDNDDDNNKDTHNEDPMLIINKNRENNDINNGLFYNTLLDDQNDEDHYQTTHGYTSLPLNCDDDHYPRVMAMERNNINNNDNNNNNSFSNGKNYHQGLGNEDDEDMNNYCNNEDIFSSFLNSLINEDNDITTTQHQSAEPFLNAINASNLGFGSDWQESSFISPSLNNKFNDFKRVGNDDNVDE